MEIYSTLENKQTGAKKVLVNAWELEVLKRDNRALRTEVDYLKKVLEERDALIHELQVAENTLQGKLQQYRRSFVCFWWIRFTQAIRARWETFLDNLESDGEELDDYESD